MIRERLARFARSPIITRNRSLSNIGRARCAAINSDFFKIIISKYINYTIGINDNNCVFVCNLILGWYCSGDCFALIEAHQHDIIKYGTLL